MGVFLTIGIYTPFKNFGKYYQLQPNPFLVPSEVCGNLPANKSNKSLVTFTGEPTAVLTSLH